MHRFKHKNAVFVVFLTGKPFFRHTDPAQASAAIAFSLFYAAFLTVISSEEAAPNAVHNVQTTAGDGDVDVRGSSPSRWCKFRSSLPVR